MKRLFAACLLTLPVIVSLAPASRDVARAIDVALSRIAPRSERIGPNDTDAAVTRSQAPRRN